MRLRTTSSAIGIGSMERCHTPTSRHGHPGQAYRASLALAEWLGRAADRIDPARERRSYDCPGRGASASDPEILCPLLQWPQNASVFEQGCTNLSLGAAHRCHSFARHPGRTSSPLRSDLRFSVHTRLGSRAHSQQYLRDGVAAALWTPTDLSGDRPRGLVWYRRRATEDPEGTNGFRVSIG